MKGFLLHFLSGNFCRHYIMRSLKQQSTNVVILLFHYFECLGKSNREDESILWSGCCRG